MTNFDRVAVRRRFFWFPLFDNSKSFIWVWGLRYWFCLKPFCSWFRRTEYCHPCGSLTHLCGPCKTGWLPRFIALDVRFARRLVSATGGIALSRNGHCRPGKLRAFPPVRPRRSNSAALMLSRNIIANLTTNLRATAVFTTAFGFFLPRRLLKLLRNGS